MKNFKYIWKQNTLKDNFSISTISKPVANILFQRGIKDEDQAKSFLSPDIHDLHNPHSLHGMKTAVERILNAIKNNEKITIFGDYDVDGMTSVSVLLLYFRHVGYDVDYYIPNRLTEGYGPSESAFRKIHAQGTNLIITVDCGISALHEVELAKQLGIDVIITDHHECPKTLPDAYSIIDPKLDICSYPYTMLAGVGIAMKIVQALMKDDFYSFLPKIIDIVALGTIADVTPLLDENRIISHFGLKKMSESDNIGMRALVEVSNIKGDINPGVVGFQIAPRLNAAGRLGLADLGVKLLTTSSQQTATELAQELNDLNYKRREIEKSITLQAEQIIEQSNQSKNDVLVVAGNNWHSGVIGIVASKITEKFYKPTVILSIENDKAVGSARSVGKFNLHSALSSMQDLFIRFGGHAQAAGLTISTDKIDIFTMKINEYASQIMVDKDKIPVLYAQQTISGEDIHHDLISDLESLEPFGVANPRPNFRINNLVIDSIRAIGENKRHLKLSLHNQNRNFDAIGFSMTENFKFLQNEDTIDIITTIEKNIFRGVETIQFKLADIRSKSTKDPTFNAIYTQYEIALARKYIYFATVKKTTPYDTSHTHTWDEKEFFNNSSYNKKQLILIENFEDLYSIWESLFDKFDGIINLYKNSVDASSNNQISNFPVCHVLICCTDFNIDEMLNKYDKIWICKNKKINQAIIPIRDDLVTTYKNIQKHNWQNEDVSRMADSCLQSVSTLILSTSILNNAGLISLELLDETINSNLLPKPNNKIDILNNELYKNLQKLN